MSNSDRLVSLGSVEHVLSVTGFPLPMLTHGLLVVDKPAGLTSRQVVDRVARLVRPAKAGHAGTLDPLATGVLVVCIGQATRLIEYVQRMPKSYRATLLFGRSSPTDDIEGPIVLEDEPRIPSLELVTAAAARFIGTIQQRPPDYSAVRVGGRRAYDLARRGQALDLPPRPVQIHDLRIVTYEYPELVFDVDCGSGTYVRSLVRDLAAALETTAVMSALVRTAIGDFKLADACPLETLNPETLAARLLPMRAAVVALPEILLSDEEVQRIVRGQSIQRPAASGDSEWAAINATGELLAILARRVDGALGPTRVFTQA
ncbi:MAG: tRNA pseudouridine(55) synthase TruB [Pirellulales bacterium]|nr:tRNA pseudouridine(55) synthase TruB [Pirellulales bacterium]